MKSATSFAVFTAFAVSSIEALLPPSVGVCYVPWRLQSITWETLQADMSQISKYFKHIRTFELSFGDYNAIDVAAAANLYIDPTVQLGNPAKIDSEINAFCEGYKRNRWAVKTVYVGNENLRNGGFGQYTVNELLGYIQRVRNCVDPSQTSVGTVQRITEWVTAPDAMILASNCDVIGVNIYPFFTISQETSIQKLQSQWNSMIYHV
ncbi:unnamed protein product [Peronospora belbahrii]|uniref:glucan endo-1,3-beta-D-glucosidase n=1 Tax=Peronospora belbahrii TaxID=622444 RepID=A0AAU9L358_9STRA|nr:unnamed protein product [Peronospora belbahrii]